MSDNLPEVGARIRVTHTQIPPAPDVFEGVVADHDPLTGCVQLTDGTVVAVVSGEAWTITVEVITPSEPEVGEFVACGGDGNPLPFFRRWSEGWMKVDGNTCDYTTWPEICALSQERWGRMPAKLVTAHQLTDLLALRDAAIAWAERITDPIGAWGDDTDRALLDAAVVLGAKYAHGEAAS